MFTRSEFDSIKREFSVVQNERRKKLKKIWGYVLFAVIMIITLMIVIFPRQFENPETVWIIPVYGSMAFLTSLIGFIVSTKYVSQKPFFEYLFPKVIDHINSSEGLMLDYEPLSTIDKEFNAQGGLFTRFANIKIRRTLSGQSHNQEQFKSLDCTMSTSNGKSQTVHFDGTYIVLNKPGGTSLQIRSSGSPKQKGVKFEKQQDIDTFKVYKEAESNLLEIDKVYLRFMEKLQKTMQFRNLYLSVLKDQIHLALWYKKHPLRKNKHFTYEVLDQYVDDFMKEYALVNELSDIESF